MRGFLAGNLVEQVGRYRHGIGPQILDVIGRLEADIAKAVGFRSAVTTRRGGLLPEHLRHLHELPREPLTRADTPSSLRCKVDGFYRALHSRLGDPVARM